EPARGTYQRVVLDNETWGTRCGDGSPYAFDVRLAPEGARLDRIVIGLQGGGICFFNADCSSRFQTARGLFTAEDDQPPVTGIMSNDPEESDFADWTKVYLPYCTQDVFIGGGITESFDALDLHRYGTVNLRAALRAFRDILWQAMDAEGGGGYRPDELIALFGGWSAGGYGTMYNYHWVLDDLQWQRTTAFPDAGLGLDNGEIGVRSFGGLLIPVWNAQRYLPPYCFSGHCAVGPDNFTAMSPRLKQVPEQQYLILSNQKDSTQQRDAFFESEPLFINRMREAYCDTKDLNGIQWYLTSESAMSQHVVSVFPNLWEGEVAGITMRDWFEGAISDPDAVEDRAEEGDFTARIEGVEPFPCNP
ncbi:MAG TPA: pectin acetylesterase-family hydrolase, partial [Terriglobales bacterium]|nr:pectin acetylesterase-family hydrolase [Terriglobales bacterium]